MTAWQKWADAGAPDEVALVTLPDDSHEPIYLGTNIETTEFKEVAPRTSRATEDHLARMKADSAELGDMQARSLQQGQSITVLLALINRELSWVSETLGFRPNSAPHLSRQRPLTPRGTWEGACASLHPGVVEESKLNKRGFARAYARAHARARSRFTGRCCLALDAEGRDHLCSSCVQVRGESEGLVDSWREASPLFTCRSRVVMMTMRHA